MDKATFHVTLLNGTVLNGTFPEDEQWLVRNKRRKLIQRTVKGETTHEVEGGDEADLLLFRAVVDDETFADAAEASLAVEALSATEVTAIERTGDGYQLEMDTFLGVQTIDLKRPSAAQVKRYRTFVTPVGCAHGKTELRTNLNIPATLFDELGGNKETPLIFKVAAVSAVVAEVQRPGEVSHP